MSSLRLVVLAVAVAVAFAVTASSASAAIITGQVHFDPPGAVPNVPVPGAVVEVRTMANAIVGEPLTTDVNGHYTKAVFGSSQPGGTTYKVIVTTPYTYVAPSDGRHDTVQVFGSDTTSGVNFSVRGSQVSGVVFKDIDASGDKQPGEPFLKDATVTIDGPRDVTVTTDANGAYTSGPVLPGGTYTVTVAKSGYTATTAPRVVTPATGGDITALPTGMHSPTGTVEGDAYAETNGQPGRQAGEPPIPGVVVTVSGTSDGTPFSQQTTSGPDGSWSLLTFAGANRTVTAAQPGAYLDGPEAETAASGTAGADTFTGITVPEDGTVGRFQFGETGATISGVTFSDRDGDGTRDAGEPAVGGRKLALAGSGFAAVATSAADGGWSAKGAPAGALTVTPETVSDALTPAPRTVSPAAGATLPATDLGFRYANVRGRVVHRQTGQPVGAVSVLLTGPASRTTKTASDGSFEFPELAPGTYGVRVDPPAGLGLGTHTPGTAGGTTEPGGIAGVVLSLAQLGTGYELGVTGAPVTTSTSTTTTAPGGSGAGGPAATTPPRTQAAIALARDTTKPSLRLRIAGRVRRGARVTVKVTATDASGMRGVKIAVGKRAAVAKRTLRLRLPRKRGAVEVTVTGTDKAGNVAKLTRTLRVR